MKKNRISFLLTFIVIQFFSLTAFSQQKYFPEIMRLNSTDLIFKQHQEAVDYNEKIASAGNNQDYIFELYAYHPKKHEDLLSIHAATGIPYDTIATLNSISNSREKLENRMIIIPTVKGLFIAENPETNLEILISEENLKKLEKSKIKCYNINDRNFFFCHGERLSPTQRAFFLDSSIRLPLDKIVVSSEFGYRNSPVYNRWKFHAGIDLVAAEGSPVYACKSGRIAIVLNQDSVFGNCIVIQHDNGLSSVYAHLSEISVRQDEYVNSGKVIGRTGQTGLVTGPHLHFEIRQNGKAANPADFFKEYR